MATAAPVEKEAYSAGEVATILDVDKRTVERWMVSGQLPSFLAGSRVRRVHRSVLDEVMGLSGGRARERYPEPAEPIDPWDDEEPDAEPLDPWSDA